MSFEKFISLRYFFSKRRFQFISFIAWLSIAGITVGLAALILVMSIFNGFRSMQIDQIIGYDPHLIIYSTEAEILNYLKQDENVSLVTFASETKIIINSGDITGAGKLLIIQNPKWREPFIQNLQMVGFNGDTLLIGGNLAGKLKLHTGDKINISSPDLLIKSLSSYRPPRVFEKNISGIFYTNTKLYDDFYLISDQSFLEILDENSYESIYVNLIDPLKVKEIEKNLEKYFKNIRFSSWEDRNNQLLSIMSFERYSTFMILSLVILLAVFNLFVSLSMTVLEKKKDSSILMIMGARSNQIKSIFRRLGFINGLIGTVLGSIVGIGLCILQEMIGWIPVQGVQNIKMPDVPIEMNFIEISLAILVAIVLTTISSYLSGLYIKKEETIKSLRGDN